MRIRSTQVASVRSSLHADWSVEAPRSASLARFPRLLARAEPTTSSVTCVKAYTGERLCAYGSAYELKILVVSRHSLIRRSRSLHRRMSYLGDRIWQQYLRMRYTVTQLLPASMPERTHKLKGQSYADSWQAHVPCRSSYPGRHSARLAFFAKRPTFDAPCTPALAPKPMHRAKIAMLASRALCMWPTTFARFGKRDPGTTRQSCPCRCDSDRPSDRELVYQGDVVSTFARRRAVGTQGDNDTTKITPGFALALAHTVYRLHS